MRLSYHDVKLFLRIFESAQNQVNKAIEKPDDSKQSQEALVEVPEIEDPNERLLVSQKPIYTDNDPLVAESSTVHVKEVAAPSEGGNGKNMSLAAFEVNSFVLCQLNSIQFVYRIHNIIHYTLIKLCST